MLRTMGGQGGQAALFAGPLAVRQPVELEDFGLDLPVLALPAPVQHEVGGVHCPGLGARRHVEAAMADIMSRAVVARITMCSTGVPTCPDGFQLPQVHQLAQGQLQVSPCASASWSCCLLRSSAALRLALFASFCHRLCCTAGLKVHSLP